MTRFQLVEVLFMWLCCCQSIHSFTLPGPSRKTLSKCHLSADLFPNEFSRTVKPSRLLKNKRSGFHNVNIVATEEECAGLAKRFELSQISSLSAELVLRPELIGNSVTNGVEVEGSCQATVTQRCVRTNEDFELSLNFPVYCIVRPVRPMWEEANEQNTISNVDRKQSIDMNNLSVMDLQKMLTESEYEDNLMEDENIYVVDGTLDVGELISQLFWLKLDPYPKKPGTTPIRRSITG